MIKSKGLRVNMENLNANREKYGLYSKLGELKSKNGFFLSQTRPYETWGFKTTFLSLRDKTLI